jgi:hypothetical protein
MGERNGAAETGSDVAVLTDQSAIVVGDPVRRFSDGAALPSLTANVPPAAPAIIPVRRVLGHLPAAAPMDLQFSPQAPSASMPKAVTVVPEVAVASRERCDGHATSGPAAVCDPVAGRSGWRLQIGGVGRGDSRVDDVFRQNDFFAALDYSDDPVSCAARSFVGRGDFVRIFPDGRSAPELLRDVGKWLDVWSGEVFGRNIFIAIPKGWLIPSTNGRLDVIVSLLIIASTTVGVRAMVIFPGVGSFFRKNSAKVTRKAIASGLAHLALLGQRPVDRVTLLECDQDFARRVVDGLDGECDLAMSCISLP